MIELEPRARRAPVPGRAHEGALPAIPLPDGALDLRRDVTRFGSGGPMARPRLGGRRELLPLELRDQRLERPREHGGHIPRRDQVAEQRLRVAQVVVLALAHGELHPKALRRQGLNPGARARNYRWR